MCSSDLANKHRVERATEEPQLTVEGVREKLKAKLKEDRPRGSGTTRETKKSKPYQEEEEEEGSEYYLGKEAKEVEQSRLAALKIQVQVAKEGVEEEGGGQGQGRNRGAAEGDCLRRQQQPDHRVQHHPRGIQVTEGYKKDSREEDTLAILEKFETSRRRQTQSRRRPRRTMVKCAGLRCGIEFCMGSRVNFGGLLRRP